MEKGITAMPKTTDQKNPVAPEREPREVRVARYQTELLESWERHEQENKQRRAYELASQRVSSEMQRESCADAALWEPRANRYGCKVLIGVWPDCPVPTQSAAAHAPDDDLTPFGGPRPVIYDAVTYRLDTTGVFLRRANWRICSPVFQTRRGTKGRPAHYAVHTGSRWTTIAVPVDNGRDWSVTLRALTKGGLKLNPELVELGPSLELRGTPGAAGDRDYFQPWRASDRLRMFFEQHEFELPT